MRLTIAFAAPALITLTCANAVMAQAPTTKATHTECPAVLTRQVRVSEIVPGGSIAGFRAALVAHANWYARHGYTQDRFALSQVVYESGNRRGSKKGGVKVMTVHSPMSDVPREKRDDEWKAFAAKYKANSRIVSTTVTCELSASGRTAGAASRQRWAR